MSKILIFGKNGQVGWELQRSLGLCEDAVFLGREDLGGNLLDVEHLISRILDERPEIVFNAAAYTAVDAAESDQETATKVNTTAVQAMAEACKHIGALLVHYSTDYVFDGSSSQAWKESDSINPVNFYGLTKAQGEQAILKSGCSAFIFRTSWVYGVHGKNFMKTMLRLGKTKAKLGIVSDQIGAPTSAEFIADVSSWLAINKRPTNTEIIHLVPNGVTSWYEFAKNIFENADGENLAIREVTPLTSDQYPTAAKRPLNSRMDNSKLISMLPSGVVKDWQYYSKRVQSEILAL